MEGTSTTSNDTKFTEETLMYVREQSRLAKKVLSTVYESENCLEDYLKKHKFRKRIKAMKQFIFTFEKYNKIWKRRDQVPDVETSDMMDTINRESRQVFEKFIQFQKRAEKADDVITSFLRDIQSHNSLVKQAFEEVMAAETLEQLTRVTIPNLEWAKSVPDPKTESLSAEWENMQLLPRISYLYEQLKQTLYPYKPLHIDVHENFSDSMI